MNEHIYIYIYMFMSHIYIYIYVYITSHHIRSYHVMSCHVIYIDVHVILHIFVFVFANRSRISNKQTHSWLTTISTNEQCFVLGKITSGETDVPSGLYKRCLFFGNVWMVYKAWVLFLRPKLRGRLTVRGFFKPKEPSHLISTAHGPCDC